MGTNAQAEVKRTAPWVCLSALTARNVVIAFAGLTVIQVLIFLLLGTGRSGRGISALILIVDNLLAIACAGSAFRRARKVAGLFWFLYALIAGANTDADCGRSHRHSVRPVDRFSINLACSVLSLWRSYLDDAVPARDGS